MDLLLLQVSVEVVPAQKLLDFIDYFEAMHSWITLLVFFNPESSLEYSTSAYKVHPFWSLACYSSVEPRA